MKGLGKSWFVQIVGNYCTIHILYRTDI